MKKTSVLIAFAGLLLVNRSLSAAPATSTGARSETETREVSGFHGIASGGSYSVTIRLGAKESLRLEGDEDAISRVETKVENGILVIRNKSSFSRNTSNRLKIYVTARSLRSLSASGSGEIEVLDVLKADDFTTSVSGSGNVRVTVNAKEYNGKVSGSGSITLSGNSSVSAISVSGSGNFRGEGFKTDRAEIRVSGSGDASIYAEKTLDVAISGSGSVRYGGNANVNTRKSGSGTVVRI